MNELPLIPHRPQDGHKGTFGTMAILGGHISDDSVMLGSAAFAAQAALRSGVGMVVFLGDTAVLVELIKLVPQAIGISGNDLKAKAEKWTSLVIGPGLGISPRRTNLIASLLDRKLPTVIDADGLNSLAAYPNLMRHVHEHCVLTPHIKEFERLAKAAGITITDMKTAADELAIKLGCIVVLKSHTTYITGGKQNWQSTNGNAVLATAGSGDVLAGLIGGLLTQFAPKQLSVFDCAQLGVTIHGKAADAWKATHGSGGLLMNELLALVPAAMDEMRSS